MRQTVRNNSITALWLSAFILSMVVMQPAFSQSAGQSVSADKYASANNSYGTPVISTSPVPDLLETNYRYNISPHQQSNLATAFDAQANHWWQYLVYWDETRQAHITRRNFSSNGAWQSPVNIHQAIGGDRLEDDSHNTITVGIDSQGYIHVSGNHHVDPLNYAISNAPHNLSAFTNRPSMIASDAKNSERRVTYPTFFNTTDGELMFFYRNQLVSPSRFASYLNRWNPATRQWQRVAKIAEGRELRFYNQRIAVDTTNGAHHGRIHIMAMWRNDARTGSGSGSGVADNEDLFHLYSDDNGSSWYQYGAGSQAKLPLSLGRVDKLILDTKPYPRSAYFVNQSGMELDAEGRPHALVTMSDTAGKRNNYYYHVWYNGNRWTVKELSKYRPGSRSAIVTTRNGEVYGMLTRSISNSSRFVLVNLTPGSSRYDKEVISLTLGMTDKGSAPNYDAGALYYHNKLSFLNARGPMSPTGNNTNYLQDATVVTVDLNQLDALRQSPFLAPALMRTFTDNSSVNASTGASKPTRLYATSSAINADSAGRPMSVKFSVKARMQGSGTGTVSIRHRSGSGTRLAGRLSFKGSGTKSSSTPMLPLFDHRDGPVEIVGSVSGGSGKLELNSVSIQIYRHNAAPVTHHSSVVNNTDTTTDTNTTSTTTAACIDEDGDGWGWDGQRSCLVDPNADMTAKRGACIDNDGDGWGWDGVDSCIP